MRANEKAARRLGAPIDACMECGSVFSCRLDRFLVKEVPEFRWDDEYTATVKYHGPFCTKDCALDWMEPRAKVMRHVRETKWTIHEAAHMRGAHGFSWMPRRMCK